MSCFLFHHSGRPTWNMLTTATGSGETGLACGQELPLFREHLRQFPFRKRLMAYTTVDAISNDSPCHFERESMPFPMRVDAVSNESMPFPMSDDAVSNERRCRFQRDDAVTNESRCRFQ